VSQFTDQYRGRIWQWEESFALRPPPKSTIIEMWRAVEPGYTLLDVVKAGYDVVVTNIHYWHVLPFGYV
jgi:hypothetical protein